MIEPKRNLGLTVGLPGEDTVVQDVYLPNTHITQSLNFDGTREDQGNAQVPDTNGSAGATQFVEITNFDYVVFDKTGKVIQDVYKRQRSLSVTDEQPGRCRRHAVSKWAELNLIVITGKRSLRSDGSGRAARSSLPSG